MRFGLSGFVKDTLCHMIYKLLRFKGSASRVPPCLWALQLGMFPHIEKTKGKDLFFFFFCRFFFEGGYLILVILQWKRINKDANDQLKEVKGIKLKCMAKCWFMTIVVGSLYPFLLSSNDATL